MRRPFIHEHFLLQNSQARELYHTYAADQPIIDYHSHLPPKDLAENRRFANLHEIWLEGDHYKWRAMRANGMAECYCTGSAEPYEKFLAWARTVPKTLRNPLYHWTHLELKRYFGIDLPLNEETAPEIWQEANRLLGEDHLRPWGIARKFKVEVICTTDDPIDTLEYHDKLADSGLPFKVLPVFRPDRALAVDSGTAFLRYTDDLGRAAGQDVSDYFGFLDALRARHLYFHQKGCRLSDHGLMCCPSKLASQEELVEIYAKARVGEAITPEEKEAFGREIMILSGRWDAQNGWVKQLHLGALRNTNARKVDELGHDMGFDSIGDEPQGQSLACYLSALEEHHGLPKTILYNNNPRDNYLFAAMIGNFQDGKVPGKIQFGSGWWFLDQKEGIEWQLNALSNLGLLSRFVGMITDSRSFMSYPRHEYFRRVLCNLLGQEMETGELPDDMELVGEMARDICYRNARAYFPFDFSN